MDQKESRKPITIRIPPTLKDQIRAAAAADGVSINTFLLKCAVDSLECAVESLGQDANPLADMAANSSNEGNPNVGWH